MPAALGEAAARFEERERVAAAAAVARVLAPRSVAVVGARGGAGPSAASSCTTCSRRGFTGRAARRQPTRRRRSRHARGRSSEIPGPVDLAVLAVPAERVRAAARECAAAGVRALWSSPPGFAEVGAEGAERQRELLAICRAAGMRLVGPNCLGVLNTAPTFG